MAYRRPTYRRTRPYTRRYAARKTYSARRPRSIYRRTYRKRRPLMSKRRILNITSEKKRDTMRVYTNVVTPRDDAGTTYDAKPAILEAFTGTSTTPNLYTFLWCATARVAINSTDVCDRNDPYTYMRGLKERIEIPSSGAPWQWRRICFTKKGSFYPTTNSFRAYQFTSDGSVRVVNQITNGYLYGELLDGVVGKDSIDPFSAKLNNQLLDIKYDKTISIQSGNDKGCLQVFKRWHPMNKTLLYQDEENGGDFNTAAYSTQSRQGMGDYYVVDIIQSGGGATKTDQLSFNPQATLYWHEK
ncbi:capsid protein [Plant associated genomovirus 5]|uniref:Capsid protein n=1 Tax=Plant associated genomovirus 5 TaxID=2584399 RepID=A0A4Y5QCS6_9VIRU|nr:capsid protein [Plant associated genomovirus 5]QCX29474.1 capsid protein [Plant associated genomovirus 5]